MTNEMQDERAVAAAHQRDSRDPQPAVRHQTTLAVWDVPSPVVIGRSFKAKVGVTCSVRCRLAHEEIEVHTAAGDKVASARLGETPWLGTGALYWQEVGLTAPAVEGVHEWLVKFVATDLVVPHEEAASNFSFRTVKPPDHLVVFKTVDGNTGKAVDDVAIRFGFYKTFTDPNGMASVEVPTGTYDLTLWKVGYEAPPRSVPVTEDGTLTVVMTIVTEPPEPYWM